MEHFVQTNVFARIRTVFARIRTVFAHLIIGCAIRYPKIGSLRYLVIIIKMFTYKVTKVENLFMLDDCNSIKVIPMHPTGV